eukprot:CAMPEP_0179122794 /NCGR_PEP_ID=MMETSP0796-20121207/57966_1 /TAXON_ID=73915 /ORGANISM="Pyrodinium bahamense, Strain pbaha01" /LENGTH=106 /DNA_ID=CAMNT_0020821421 /DNA_START=223 /DNA_END=539 /DNA_ORIENTATION=-
MTPRSMHRALNGPSVRAPHGRAQYGLPVVERRQHFGVLLVFGSVPAGHPPWQSHCGAQVTAGNPWMSWMRASSSSLWHGGLSQCADEAGAGGVGGKGPAAGPGALL